MFALHKEHQIDSSKDALADKAAQRYLHYIHGLNPLSLVYLSNMYNYGAYKSVNEFYHSWFTNGSALWDRVGVSKYGPPPGFLTGGPNPYFKVASCCPASCGNDYSNKMCTSESVTPPAGQPPQKAYKDFNTSWPLNSWEVSENSTGYQIRYIKLLARYIQ
jgi:hypothetical protein